MTQKFANAARAYLASSISDSATTVTIDGGGSLFPEIASPDFSRAVLQDASGIEVVLITAHTANSDSFTVTRGQEGTTARSFATGSVFGLRMTAADGDMFVAKVSGPGSATDGALAAFDGTTGKLIKQAATVTIAQGGTGQTTRQAAMDALAGAVTAGQYLRGDGTDVVMSAIQAADVPTLNQNTTGNAATATTATTATNLAGGAANQIAYQTGSGTTGFATAPSASNQVLNWNGSAFTWSAGTISGVALGSNLNALTLGSYLTGTSYNGSGAVTAAVDATSANTASKVVARDASGNFSAGTITATLSGNASTATSATTATTATTANALNTGNNYQVNSIGVGAAASGTAGRINATTGVFTPNTTGVSTGVTVVNGDLTAYRSGGTTGVVYLSSAGTHYLYWDGTNYTLNAGNLVCTGNVTAYSDERLKKDWAKLPDDFLLQLAKIKHGTYTRIDSGDRQAGVSAQQMQAFLPEVVQTDEKGNLTLAYGNAALVAAVKLAERVVALEARIAALEAKG